LLALDLEATVDAVVRGAELIEAQEHGVSIGYLSHTGHHRVTLEILGTVAATEWITVEAVEVACRLLPGPVSPDRDVIFARLVDIGHELETDWVGRLLHEQGFTIETSEDVIEGHVSSIPLIAKRLREISGLNAEQLAAIFPVRRESYQRWVSGAIQPSQHNLERLVALERLFEAAGSRVGDVRLWLHVPDVEGSTPYDRLRRGQLSAVWSSLMRVAGGRPFDVYKDEAGMFAFRIGDSVHSDNASTPEWEADEGEEDEE
jgi:transcriptional regulator with XRE-family HTH domain